MNDPINRQDAIDAICKAGCGSGYCGIPCDEVKAIEQLPSAHTWIPVAERLPSEGEYALVTEKWHGYVWMWRLQYIDDEPTWEENGYNIDIDEAVAWMPSPEPYKEVDA